MIIQCEKCQTRFRLDDARVTDRGVKVRCTKCKHVFKVQKEGSESGLFEPEVAMADFSSPAPRDEAPAAAPENQQVAAESFQDTPVDFGTPEETSTPSEPADTGGEIDFSSLDFGEDESEPDSTSPSTLPVDAFTGRGSDPAPEVPRKEALQGLDFSDDDMFGVVVQSAPEVTSETISFDFEGDGFAESMDMSSQESGGKGSTLFSLDAPGDAPFSLGEIDFGDELTSVAIQQVNPEDLKPSQKILFAPLAEAQDKSADDDIMRAFLGEHSGAGQDQDELPPLSIASRRKQSPLFGGLIAVAVLLVISVLGYFGYSSFSTPRETVATDSGKIAVRAVKAAYIKNDKAGELLVISGEAVNEYPQPRAALQVKVSLFDSGGKSIATKIAYGGNPLTEEQLESLPLDKIEAAMANQFGDSLANMEVAPGKSIPFVAVLANIPKGAKDFGVQSAGSTVATGKQQ